MVAFYGENGTVVIGGGNDYKIYDVQSRLLKEVKHEDKFDAVTGLIL